MRKEVSLLIEELREACRRPLFQEIALFNKSYSEQQRRKRVRPPQKLNQAQQQQPQLSSFATDAQQQDAFETASQASSNATSAVFAARLMSSKRSISGSSMPSPRIRNSHHSHRKRRWDELVQDAAKLSPYMTRVEHGLVAKLVSILLLGFLLPHSTGNEFFLTQHATDATKASVAALSCDKSALVLELSLADRLEHAAMFYSTTPTPPGRCTDAHVDLAFWVFLQNLSNYLQATSWFVVDHDNVDLWHILAMAIDPAPTSPKLPSSLKGHKGIARARQFMQSLVPHSFYLPYGHRRFVVQMINHDLVLPRRVLGKQDLDDDHHITLSPWLEGAIFHLRASLSSYAISSVSLADAHAAHAALANLTIQTMGNSTFPSPEDEWTRYLARMVNDRGHYGCSGCCFEEAQKNDDDSSFCPHAARGRLLDSFFSRIVQQSTDTDDDNEEEGDISQRRYFITHALSSLADAVEWQAEWWTTAAAKDQESPCLLASLLHAAISLFYFLKESHDASEEEEEEREEQKDKKSLLQSAIQLVHHPDRAVANQSAVLVSLAFSRNQNMADRQLLLESVKAALESQVTILCQDEVPAPLSVSRGQISVISTAARLSRSFASSLLLFLLSKRRESWKSENFDELLASLVARWIVTICQAQPWVSLKYEKEILELFQQEKSQETQSHLLVAILSSRLAFFFAKPDQVSQVKDLVVGWLKEDNLDNWRAMQMARRSLVVGNFSVAKHIFEHLMQFSFSEKTFLWLSALTKVAEAEAALEIHAAKGIPTATIDHQAAVSYLVSLQTLDNNGCFQFLTKVIKLRMEFIDLIAALRHFVREMRLTGSGPTKFTRSAWHVQNIPLCFEGLANRYHGLYRQYGLFLSQQSRTALRTVQAACHFLASISKKAFAESFGEANNKLKDDSGHRRSGDVLHPLTILTRRLDEMVVRDMSTSIDPMTRAAATLEVLNGVLMAPFPFPRDLTVTLPVASLRLTADPEQAADMHFNSHTTGPVLKVIEAFPRLSFKFIVNGSISKTFGERATIPCSTFSCSYMIVYTGPLHDSDENNAEEKHEEEAATTAASEDNSLAGWKFASSEPLVTPISPSRRFFISVECPPLLQEGNYCLTVRPVLRDIRGGEWTLSVVDERDLSIPIRVSRSREMHG